MTQPTAAPTHEDWDLSDAEKLRILADWHDVQDDNLFHQAGPSSTAADNREVQADLRRIATELETAPETAAERDRLRLEIEQCHAKSTCCCGDYIKHHSTHSGHNPVSMYDSDLFNVETERDRLKVVNEGLVEALTAAGSRW